jgi:hypothetical protein
MPFKKGKSGNPKGKPVGAESKSKKELRDKITLIVNGQVDKVEQDLNNLSSKDRLNILLQLMRFVTPQLKAIELDSTIQDNSDFKPIIINLSDEKGAN